MDWKGSVPQDFTCLGCIFGKSHRLPFPKDGHQIQENPGDVVHMDVAGPMSEASLGGAKYFLLFKDDSSGMMFMYFMRTKDETFGYLKKFLLDFMDVARKYQVARIRSDNGTELTSDELEAYLVDRGIKHETSVPYTPEQNGFVERSIRTVCEAARSMVHGTNLPKAY